MLLFRLYICIHVLNVLFACVFSNTDTVSWLVGVQIKVMLQQPLTCGSSSMLPTCFPSTPHPTPLHMHRQWCIYTCTLLVIMLQGDVKLPATSQMWEDIRLKEAAMAKLYYKSQRHTIQVDYISFMDELAELNGCKPDVGEYQWSHPCVVFISFLHFAWKAAYTQLTFYLSKKGHLYWTLHSASHCLLCACWCEAGICKELVFTVLSLTRLKLPVVNSPFLPYMIPLSVLSDLIFFFSFH